jgi:hypothetical protein
LYEITGNNIVEFRWALLSISFYQDNGFAPVIEESVGMDSPHHQHGEVL